MANSARQLSTQTAHQGTMCSFCKRMSTKIDQRSCQVDAPPGLSQVLRSCIEESGVMPQLPWHLYHTAMIFYSMIGGNPDNPQELPIATHADGHREAKLNKRQRLGQPQSLFVSQSAHLIKGCSFSFLATCGTHPHPTTP